MIEEYDILFMISMNKLKSLLARFKDKKNIYYCEAFELFWDWEHI